MKKIARIGTDYADWNKDLKEVKDLKKRDDRNKLKKR